MKNGEPLRALIGCESSGIVREAFNAYAGVHAISCDLKPCEDGRTDYHYQGDLLDIMNSGEWDILIAFPPCTYLCSSGLHWNRRRPERKKQTEAALDFVRKIFTAKIPHIGLENPIGCIGTRIRKWDQIIQPYDFGENASKATCLWLKNLPPLRKTKRFPGRWVLADNGLMVERWANQTDSGQNRLAPGENRSTDRARTYPGIAAAMAAQWIPYILEARK